MLCFAKKCIFVLIGLAAAIFAYPTRLHAQSDLQFSGFRLGDFLVGGVSFEKRVTDSVTDISEAIVRKIGQNQNAKNKVIFFSVGGGSISDGRVREGYMLKAQGAARSSFLEKDLDRQTCNFVTFEFDDGPLVHWMVADTSVLKYETVELCIIYTFGNAFGHSVPFEGVTSRRAALRRLITLLETE